MGLEGGSCEWGQRISEIFSLKSGLILRLRKRIKNSTWGRSRVQDLWTKHDQLMLLKIWGPFIINNDAISVGGSTYLIQATLTIGSQYYWGGENFSLPKLFFSHVSLVQHCWGWELHSMIWSELHTLLRNNLRLRNMVSFPYWVGELGGCERRKSECSIK